MTKKLENATQQREQTQSRRSFFTWAGQVAAGVSVAGIGLGLANPMDTLAASLSKPANAQHSRNTPDCLACPSAGTYCCSSCNVDANCPQGHNFIKYNYAGGCYYPGHPCVTYIACATCSSQGCPGANC